MMTINALRAHAASTRMVPVTEADRDEFARALVLQGYDAPRAHRMAYDELEDNDGALQMCARVRLAATIDRLGNSPADAGPETL